MTGSIVPKDAQAPGRGAPRAWIERADDQRRPRVEGTPDRAAAEEPLRRECALGRGAANATNSSRAGPGSVNRATALPGTPTFAGRAWLRDPPRPAIAIRARRHPARTARASTSDRSLVRIAIPGENEPPSRPDRPGGYRWESPAADRPRATREYRGTTTDDETAQRIMADFGRAYFSKRPEQLAEVITADAEWHFAFGADAPDGRVRRGLDGFMRGIAENDALFERLRFNEVHCRGLGDDQIVMTYRVDGRYRGGDEFALRGVELITVRDNRVALKDVFWKQKTG